MNKSKRSRFVTGLDLGQASEFTALAILQRTERSVTENERGPWQSHYDVVHLERLPIGTGYGTIRDQLTQRFDEEPLLGSHLAIDHTGVGKAILNLFRDNQVAAEIHPVTVTAGACAIYTEGDWLIPKKDLVGELQVLLQGRRLHLASGLSHADDLVKELTNFRIKLTPTANDLVTTWREGRHDDLVLAVAIAAWAGEKYLRHSDGGVPYVIGPLPGHVARRMGLW